MSSKSKKLEILQRREAVAKRYITGQTLRQIAESLEVALGTVASDLKAVRESWQQNAQAAISEHKAKELARLDHLEMTAWTAWSLSLGDLIVTTQRGKGKATAPPAVCPKCMKPLSGATTCSCGFTVATTGTEVVRQTVNRKSAGDPRFQKIILECIRQRCAIIGLNNPLPMSGNDFLPVIGFEVVEPVVTHDETESETVEATPELETEAQPFAGEGDGSNN